MPLKTSTPIHFSLWTFNYCNLTHINSPDFSSIKSLVALININQISIKSLDLLILLISIKLTSKICFSLILETFLKFNYVLGFFNLIEKQNWKKKQLISNKIFSYEKNSNNKIHTIKNIKKKKKLNKLRITYSTSYHWKVLCDVSDKAGSRWGCVWRGMILRNTPVEIVAHNFKLFSLTNFKLFMEAAELESYYHALQGGLVGVVMCFGFFASGE